MFELNSRLILRQVEAGTKTQIIYSLIRDQKFNDAINLLNNELMSHPRSREALSLLGHCYYYIQDFDSASDTFVH